jgi:methionyl-tRNA formyltransferase
MARVIFAGTTELGIPTLEMLKRDFDLALVITPPDRLAGRKKTPNPSPVKKWAVENNVRIEQPEKISDLEGAIKEIAPDLLVVVAYGHIIPKNILDIPKKGSINFHPSLLPKYRGPSPIKTAIMNDEKETGVTIMVMDEKMDHGPLLSLVKMQVDESDNHDQILQKLAGLGADTLKDVLPKWMVGEIKPEEQDHDKATFSKMIRRDDARIDWTQSSRSILQKIKALNPEPGTWTTLDGKSVKIMGAEEHKNTKIELPGQIYAEGRDCFVKCGDYSLKLTLVQPEGKNPVSGQDFLNGLKNLETKVLV